MLAPKSYQLDKTLDFIRDKVTTREWDPAAPIPSSRTLSKEIGVSQATVIKAVALLKKEKILASIPRCRVRIGVEYTVQPSVPKAGASGWLRVRQKLEHDILSGAYAGRCELPSVKEFQSAYGVCFRTMRRALDSLVADALLATQGKKWAQPAATHDGARSVVRFISHRGFVQQRSAINQDQSLVANLFERECANRGLRFEVSEVDFYDSSDVRRMIRELRQHDPPLGFVFDIWWYTTLEFRALTIDLLDRVAAAHVPVTIIDELGDFDLPAAFSANPLIQVFSVEGYGAGERIAGHLLGLGHLKAVFISPSHLFGWSRRRLAGAKDRFDRAGLVDAVVPVVSTDIDVILLHILEASRLSDETIRPLLAVDRTPRQAEDQFDALKRFRPAHSLHDIDPRAATVLRRDLDTLAHLAKEKVSVDFFKAQVRSAIFNAESQAYRIILGPLLRQAFACTGATAWICVTDGIARAALKFLAANKIDVPEQVSVSGFDNNPAIGAENALTSYDFNAPVFVQRMLNFIVRPPRTRGVHHHVAIEIEGIVIGRGSTGRAKL